MRAVLPVMPKQRSGHIINISSVAGVVGLKHCAAYGASKFAVEGLSLSVATKVEQFGIKITVVEPGFFRTDLLDPRNVSWATNAVEDYAAEGTSEAMWSPYHGTQPGDPAKLGDALVTIAGMKNPPKLFVAGSDALAVITPAIEARLETTRAHEELSRSTDGLFEDLAQERNSHTGPQIGKAPAPGNPVWRFQLPSWAQTRTLLIQRGQHRPLNSSNLQPFTRARVPAGGV